MSHKMFICKFCWRKKKRREKERAVGEWSRGNSKPASLYGEREREGSPRPRRDFRNFKHTPADPISLCGHFTYSALRRYERTCLIFQEF